MLVNQDLVLISLSIPALHSLVLGAVTMALENAHAHAHAVTDEGDALLTRRQAAALIGVSMGTIDNFVREGKIEKLEANQQTRFRKGDVLAVCRWIGRKS